MTPGKSAVIEAAEPAKQSSITPADPCTIVIFGASGDLSRRKLIPALYGLAAQNCLARRFAIIGFARTPMTDEAFQKTAVESGQEIRRRQHVAGSGVQGIREGAGLRLGRIPPARSVREIEEAPRGARPRAQSERQSSLLSGHAAGHLSRDDRAAGEGRAGEDIRTENPGCASSSRSRSAAIWPRREN